MEEEEILIKTEKPRRAKMSFDEEETLVSAI